MPSVTLFRRKGVWYGKWLMENGEYKRRSLGTTSKSDAQKIAASMERKLLLTGHGVETPKDFCWKHTLKLFDAWGPHHLSPQTHYLYRTFFAELFAHCGRPTLSSLKPADVEAWKLALLSDGQKPTTVNAKIRQARSVFQWARKHASLKWNGPDPFVDIERVKEPERRPKFLTREQLSEFLWTAAVASADTYKVVLLGAFGGLRKKEIDSAEWPWVNWERGVIYVTPSEKFVAKTPSSAKPIPMHPRLLMDLYALWEHEGRPTSGYIVAPHLSMPKTHRGYVGYRFNFRRHFGKAATLAGMEWVTPHVLRHSLATAMAEKGMSVFEIQSMLRHATPNSTRIYVHNRAERLNLEGVL